MKKKYVTPMIAVEHYELTQAIAACNVKIGFLNSTCVLKDPDATPQMKDLAVQGFFVAGVSPTANCSRYNTNTDAVDGYCYHTNTGATFNS